jgi:hypothetical protein
MQRYGSVYVVTHTATGKQYVGQTRQKVGKRWDAHYRTAMCKTARQTKFGRFLAGETPAAFTVNEVFVAFDAAGLNTAEIQLIAELAPCLNTTSGGAGHRGVVASLEVRRKRSEAAKARWANPEWKAMVASKIRAANNNEEARQRLRAIQRDAVAARWAGHVKAVPAPKLQTAPRTHRQRLGRSEVARLKWKPVYCPELQTTFLCGKYAAEYLGVLRTSVANAVKSKGKLLHKYSLEMVI